MSEDWGGGRERRHRTRAGYVSSWKGKQREDRRMYSCIPEKSLPRDAYKPLKKTLKGK